VVVVVVRVRVTEVLFVVAERVEEMAEI
jgi:hypothetical protein